MYNILIWILGLERIGLERKYSTNYLWVYISYKIVKVALAKYVSFLNGHRYMTE